MALQVTGKASPVTTVLDGLRDLCNSGMGSTESDVIANVNWLRAVEIATEGLQSSNPAKSVPLGEMSFKDRINFVVEKLERINERVQHIVAQLLQCQVDKSAPGFLVTLAELIEQLTPLVNNSPEARAARGTTKKLDVSGDWLNYVPEDSWVTRRLLTTIIHEYCPGKSPVATTINNNLSRKLLKHPFQPSLYRRRQDVKSDGGPDEPNWTNGKDLKAKTLERINFARSLVGPVDNKPFERAWFYRGDVEQLCFTEALNGLQLDDYGKKFLFVLVAVDSDDRNYLDVSQLWSKTSQEDVKKAVEKNFKDATAYEIKAAYQIAYLLEAAALVRKPTTNFQLFNMKRSVLPFSSSDIEDLGSFFDALGDGPKDKEVCDALLRFANALDKSARNFVLQDKDNTGILQDLLKVVPDEHKLNECFPVLK